MSYITLTNGTVLEVKLDAEHVVAALVKGERDGKVWMPDEDGGFYRISSVVSVVEKMDTTAGLDSFYDLMFGRRGDAE